MITELYGIDISNNNGLDLDLTKVPTSILDFVFMKASEGTGFIDPTLSAHAAQCIQCGFLRGFYHFLQPGSGQMQAKNFLTAVGPFLQRLDVVIVDVEENGPDIELTAAGFCGTVQTILKQPVWVYASRAFIHDNLQRGLLKNQPLWLADWGAEPGPAPAPWSLITAWQSSSKGNIPGINNFVDTDTFYGNIHNWKHLSRG